MRCQQCGGRMLVVDTANVSNNEVYRRRKCASCGALMYTAESEVDRDENFSKKWEKARCLNYMKGGKRCENGKN